MRSDTELRTAIQAAVQAAINLVGEPKVAAVFERYGAKNVSTVLTLGVGQEVLAELRAIANPRTEESEAPQSTETLPQLVTRAMKLGRVDEMRAVMQKHGVSAVADVKDVEKCCREVFDVIALGPKTLAHVDRVTRVAFDSRRASIWERRADATAWAAANQRVLTVYSAFNLDGLSTRLLSAYLRDMAAELLPPEQAAVEPPFNEAGCIQARVWPRATPAWIERVRLNVREELRATPNWVGCDRSPEAKAGDVWKSTKKPLNPHTGANARVNDASTWSTFDVACAFALRDPRVATVGVNLRDTEFVGFDFDDAFTDDDVLRPSVAEVLNGLPATYCERSPSRRGLRLFARGEKPAWMQGSAWSLPGGGRLEVYDRTSNRYLTVSGELFDWRAT